MKANGRDVRVLPNLPAGSSGTAIHHSFLLVLVLVLVLLLRTSHPRCGKAIHHWVLLVLVLEPSPRNLGIAYDRVRSFLALRQKW